MKKTAVLVPVVNICGEAHLLLTRRSRRISHPGQISFPGGFVQEGESLLQCALREMEEEIGARISNLEEVYALGETVTLTSGKEIAAFLGFIDSLVFLINDSEVEELIFLSLEAVKRATPEPVLMPSGRKTIRYRFPGLVVWGATARIIESSLWKIEEIVRLRKVKALNRDFTG